MKLLYDIVAHFHNETQLYSYSNSTKKIDYLSIINKKALAQIFTITMFFNGTLSLNNHAVRNEST